ncbi:DUF2509 family protein [Franconibacter pulveris]|uniref:DUF2509 family protein n=1 Tax=Franconibacter pulveris TaxID=435910 RepID=A0A0J8VLW8_9ENTR|nr:DUF2509 family protein [Franconibacter pulveris]KMV34473.1 hypothetical protein ACH50_09970 [Franconibacter pulveris]
MTSQQRGVSSLSAVLLLLLLGSFMLSGLQQQLSARFASVASESLALKQFSTAVSTLAWAEKQRWGLNQEWQCQAFSAYKGRACAKRTVKGEAIVAAQAAVDSHSLALWRWAEPVTAGIKYRARGWIDVCPLEASQCQLPVAP